jgi:ubiquinone/menaquinone biosynthesis C-methylase UbiE
MSPPSVTGVDISQELLAAAADLSRHIRPPIEFRLGDAEQLPFDNGAFDGVISTFGVMFAIDQATAAAELGRVCRSGGGTGDLGAGGGGGEIFRGYRSTHRRTTSTLIAVSLG